MGRPSRAPPVCASGHGATPATWLRSIVVARRKPTGNP